MLAKQYFIFPKTRQTWERRKEEHKAEEILALPRREQNNRIPNNGRKRKGVFLV